MPAASSLECPSEIASQNGHRSDRCNTGGLPGERSFARSDRSDFNFFELINTSNKEVLRPQVEFTQYVSIRHSERLAEAGVEPSVGSKGGSYDNAMAESFFANLECELIDRRSWKSFAEARMAVFTWIEGWYNPRRRHSGIGQKSPINFEKKLQNKADADIPATAELTSASDLKI